MPQHIASPAPTPARASLSAAFGNAAQTSDADADDDADTFRRGPASAEPQRLALPAGRLPDPGSLAAPGHESAEDQRESSEDEELAVITSKVQAPSPTLTAETAHSSPSPVPRIKHASFPCTSRFLLLGCGCIGQGVLPLLLRHIDIQPGQITILAADERGQDTAKELGIRYVVQPLDESNYVEVLDSFLRSRGDFLLNLSVNVASISLIELARDRGWLYLDTSVEPWEGGFQDTSLDPAARSNYAFRETALALKKGPGGPTAVITHGANPGLVSHFAKRAMLDVAEKLSAEGKFAENVVAPRTREEWAKFAMDLGIKVIQVAERDTQIPIVPKRPHEFVNTWSVDGFVGEASQPSELGWGTHERHFPHDGKTHEYGPKSSIYLMRPGASVRVRSWTPLEGPYHGFLITHGESISIPDYLTVKDGDGNVVYRPTVYYAYHPSDSAVLSLHEFCGKNFKEQPEKRMVVTDIHDSGIDELGVLLMGWDSDRVYWYGSRLSMGEARELCKNNNATSLQVTAPVLAGVIWAIENPDRGVVEPDDMDFERILEVCGPYLGPVVGVEGHWTPLEGRGELFPEDLDTEDPWQFKNFRVI